MDMRKKGFTLIELLAVIVILAVIALIAVPVILSLVDKSRRKAAEESAVLYVDTIENMLMLNNIENTDGKTYKVKGRTVVDENDKVILNLEIKGDVPYNGVENVIKINSGFIEEANLRFNSYYVHYEMDMTTKKFKTCTFQKGFLDKCDGTGEVKPVDPNVPEEPKRELEEKLKLGDYIRYTPVNTSYTLSMEETFYNKEQTLYPNELNLWRVIRKNEDGTIDLVSDQVSSTGVTLGTNGTISEQNAYKNAIGVLNKAAKAYETEGITVGSRHMGYDGTVEEFLSEIASDYNVDTGYETDVELVNTALKSLTVSKAGDATYARANYWLASRAGYVNGNGTYLLFCISLRGEVGSTSVGNLHNFPIRPIVVLNSSLSISAGEGTFDLPYELMKEG
jgi:type IV pilus assembly protein PilA